MADKYRLYRSLYPVRAKRQSALRAERLRFSLPEFQSEIGQGTLRDPAAVYLWERLRDMAFVADFRPSASDDLGEVFALSPSSIRDDVVDGLIDHLGLRSEHIDFAGFSFASLRTPRDIVDFVEKMEALQDRPTGTRFLSGSSGNRVGDSRGFSDLRERW